MINTIKCAFMCMNLIGYIPAKVISAAQEPSHTIETIRFATTATYPPFEWVNSTGQIVGYEVDLVNALCEQIKANCTFSNMVWDRVIYSLKHRQIDASVSGLDITRDRLREVNFSKPFFKNSAMLIVRKDSPVHGFNELVGKRVGMENGVTHQRYIQVRHPGTVTTAYTSWNDAIMDLKAKRIDAVLADTPVVMEWLKSNPDLRTAGDKITDADFFGTGYGIMFGKNNPEMVERFNKALDVLSANGVMKKLNEKWFPEAN